MTKIMSVQVKRIMMVSESVSLDVNYGCQAVAMKRVSAAWFGRLCPI